MALCDPTEPVITMEPPRLPARICGTPAFTVCPTPDRLTSIMSCQIASGILCSLLPNVPMPAFATMMSSRPSCFNPAAHQGFERVEISHVGLRRHNAAILGLDQVGGLGEVVRCRMRVSHV